MIDIKQLKGSLDLAQMNHAAFNSEASKTALEKAQADYEAALAGQPILVTVVADTTQLKTLVSPVPPIGAVAAVDVLTGLLVTVDSASDHGKAGVGGSGEGNDAQKKSVS